MNIGNVDSSQVPQVPNRLEYMFERQSDLMHKYNEIEAANGLLQTVDCPVGLHDRHGQARLKDFSYRVLEEIAEAMDAVVDHGLASEHAQEEIADAAHFLIEMCLLARLLPQDLLSRAYVTVVHPHDDLEALFDYTRSYADINDPEAGLNDVIVKFLTHLGMTNHLLKNKPWKQSHVLTDVEEYYNRLARTFVRFVWVCLKMGIDDNKLYDLHFRKYEVNKFRQRSEY